MHIKHLIASMTLIMTVQATSAALNQSESIEKSILNHAQQSQKTISTSADNNLELLNEIKSLKENIDQLTVYQQHLQRLLTSQQNELSSLDIQLNELTETKQSIVPLMYKMLDALTQYVDDDFPLRKTARKARVNSLKTLMVRADIADAEKYRRIMEAYQIELDYVNKLSVYLGPITVDNEKKQVEILHLGHLSLIARSLNKQHYWVWNNQQQQWTSWEKETQQLDHAYLVANKLASPALLFLPLSIAEVNQ